MVKFFFQDLHKLTYETLSIYGYVSKQTCFLFKPQLDTKWLNTVIALKIWDKLPSIKTYIQTRDLWLKFAGQGIL